MAYGAILEQMPSGFNKSESGSYVGTGTYGSQNPTSLTFSFEPKLVVINYKFQGTSEIYSGMALITSKYGVHFAENSITKNIGIATLQSELINNTLSWFLSIDRTLKKSEVAISGASPLVQLNDIQGTYYYTAFG